MLSPHSSIQGLIELARRDGVDMRPALLRAITDLFVLEPTHTPADRARFAELACRLLDGVETPVRVAIAERLASYPGTPAVVAARLARDEIAVADSVLRRSPLLGEAELHAILDSRGIAHAIAIAARTSLPRSVLRRLAEAGTCAPRTQTKAEPRQAETDPALTIALARRYLVADPNERRLILTAMPCCPAVDDEERLRRIGHGFGALLERAALRHRAHEFALLLRQTAGLPGEVAARAVTDPSGEIAVAICRALEIPFDATSRILLFLNPQIGASVQRVFGLADWFEKIGPAAARRLMAAWCVLGPEREKRKIRSEPRAERLRFDSRRLAVRGSTLAEQLPVPRRAAGY
jgi:uncharacterized protein (DUF2336 family)